MDIVKTLTSMHYDPRWVVSNGDDAVVKARKYLPDIVLMDIGIPGSIDGLGAADIIRKELDIPVIFVTAYGDDAVIEKVKKVNPYGYVLKPFREQCLKVAIDLALSRKSGELQDRMKGMPVLLPDIPDKADETNRGDSSLSDIRSLIFKGFFEDLVLLLYSHTEVKEQVFASFIEKNIDAGKDLLFAYSFSRAHRCFLREVQRGKIRICRIKDASLPQLMDILSESYPSDRPDLVPPTIIIDFSERFDPADIQGTVDQLIAIRHDGVPVSGIIALAVGTCDESQIHLLMQKIPHMVVATSRGTLISAADRSFPLETLSFLPRSVVDETVKKVLEPVVLSLLEKPISGHDIVQEIRGRYNISVPKARVYMQLYELQKMGYLSVKTVGKSKLYVQTESGKVHIQQKLVDFISTFQHILAEMSQKNRGTWEKRE